MDLKSESNENGEGNSDPMDTTGMESSTPEEYFHSYQDLEVHRLMLQDEVRTNAYRNAIEKNPQLFRDKIVMDVGAGTGILSLFCAKAGAKKVYAVEASDLANLLPKVVQQNGFDGVIEVIHSKVEDITQELKVDVIISEWMGFYLLHESMLESVIFARDKFLNANGHLFPNKAHIYAAPCKVPELWKNHHEFWTEKQYGFDLSAFADSAKVKDKPDIICVPSDCLLSDPQLLWELDLMTILKTDKTALQSLKDLRFFSLEEDGDMQGVCVWFTCGFPTPSDSDDEITLSTAPWDPETHWKQTVVLFPEATNYEAGDIMGWEFIVEKTSLEQSSRSYRIHLKCLDPEEEEHPIPCLCGTVKCELVRHFMTTHPNKSAENTEDTVEES